MKIPFIKYHGTGNDFVIIDNRKGVFNLKNFNFIKHICSRRFGVGADGLIVLENDTKSDFKMVYFNADGNESTMCGNGGRCIVAFAKKLNIIKNEAKFRAIDGIHKATIDSKNNVNLKMKNVDEIEVFNNDFILDTGSPHYVKIIENDSKDFVSQARKIRNSSRFKKEGININFIQLEDNNKINIRTYERGVEDETYACGTGCVAAALSVMINSNQENFILNTKGGEIEVRAKKNKQTFNNIWLFGPTKMVYEGEIIFEEFQ